MAPRGHALPQATTESAREVRKAFFCDLCQKGYARMNDFEAHEGSYDHQHRKRLKEMKQLTKDPNAASKAERERKANEEAGLKSINLSLSGSASGAAPGGKKKPVFKSTLQPHNAASVGSTGTPSAGSAPSLPTSAAPVVTDTAPSTKPLPGTLTTSEDSDLRRTIADLVSTPVHLAEPRHDGWRPSSLPVEQMTRFLKNFSDTQPPTAEEVAWRTSPLDPRARNVEQELRARGKPGVKGQGESEEASRLRRMGEVIARLRGEGTEVHPHVLGFARERGIVAD
ncbi:hypothetical protein KC331_g14942 [Hortaea werneckii]|uniref:C2H2-type domain-containing protein n=1 Tax=Hortaea werneckii TaxID=91943 RepID=A0A3M7CK86_HORWE|nr:hypothetical protein KC331_g14942 [Hortaea werneckii]KAI7704330.1 hypothetical protein KC353_g13545 [Hortaea werneckii]RMY52498.1 hypothetical protein D0865_05762 [Hortaea werneckii]